MPAPYLSPAQSVSAAPARIAPLAIHAHTVTSALGAGLQAMQAAVRQQRHGLVPNADNTMGHGAPALATAIGAVAGLDDAALPTHWVDWDCRATRLVWMGLQGDNFMAQAQAAVQRHGAHRVGCVLGTSGSTIAASEFAYRHLAADGGFPPALQLRALHSPHALTAFAAMALGVQGPAATVSTACSSSARVFGQAERWLRLGLVDAVVVGGVDSLCDSILYGFHALGLVSPRPCQPFDAARQGISVGEAVGFALLQRSSDSGAQAGQLQLLGYGESNDAHHMSSPHPQGLGAELALDDALARAGVAATDVDYLNLHGTGTPANDAVEAALVARRYRSDVHASATKGLTGHTMGAAGMIEAALCLMALDSGWCSGSAQVSTVDPAFEQPFQQQLQLKPQQRTVHLAASHSFGFGGNNCVLLLGRSADAASNKHG